MKKVYDDGTGRCRPSADTPFADIDLCIIDRRTNAENRYPCIRSVVSPIYPVAQLKQSPPPPR